MSGRKSFVGDIIYISYNISDTDNSSDSDFKYTEDSYSKTDEAFSDSFVSSDESENLFYIQKCSNVIAKITVQCNYVKQLADILISEKTESSDIVNENEKDLPLNFAKEKIPKGFCLPKG